MFDSKKMEEQMGVAIEKQLQNSMKLIEKKIQKSVGV
jgi:hypothetical protein